MVNIGKLMVKCGGMWCFVGDMSKKSLVYLTVWDVNLTILETIPYCFL